MKPITQKDADFKQIQQILKYVWENKYSSFYRDKYTKAGINPIKDIKTLDDFQKIPFLTKEELVNSDPLDRLFLPTKRLINISISSGTTGSSAPAIVFKSRSSKIHSNNNREQLKILKQRNTLFLFPPIRASQYSVYQPTKKTPNSGVLGIKVAGDITNLPLTAKITAKLHINVLHTSPTALYLFTPHLQKEYLLENIKFIKLSGEFCSYQKAVFIKKHFKNAIISYQYGMSENEGSIGINCKHLNSILTNCFHPNPEIYFETIPSSENKELVITNLIKNMFPLIRYRTGDAVEIEDFACKCGEVRQLKLLGRINNDVIRIHGAFIFTHLVEKAILPFNSYLKESGWQLHVFENMIGDKIMPLLKLQLVLRDKYKPEQKDIKAFLEKNISQKLFLTSQKTLTNLVSEKIFLPLEIEWVASFSYTPKHKYIVSHLT